MKQQSAQPVAAEVTGAHHGEVLLRAILDSASQGILSVLPDGTIALANSKAVEIFGYQGDDLTGMSVEDLLPESLREAHQQYREQYFAQPRTRPMGVGLDLMGRRRNGQHFPVEISLSYIETSEGRFAIVFVSDISMRKELEVQLGQSLKMEAMGRLAGGIAHDFNNLLMIISGYNRLLLDRISPDNLRGYSEEVQKAAERAAALVQQLLTFSRRQVIKPRRLNLNDLIRDVQNMLGRVITENIEFRIHLSPDLLNIQADPSQMEQVLFNLVLNARDAMPRGGRLVVETQNVELDKDYARTHLGVEPGPYVMLAVSDTGVGMDAETRRRIYEPFFTTKANKGTGLGLATVYGIVKQNRGDIWLYSEPRMGTIFKVYVPTADGRVEGKGVKRKAAKLMSGTETVLVVEDEPAVRKLMVDVLRNYNYTVHEAADGQSGSEYAKRTDLPLDLLITDVILPHKSGRELAEELLRAHPALKVLYVSGYTENVILHQGVLESAVNFLPKPFAYDDLLRKVRKVLGPQQ